MSNINTTPCFTDATEAASRIQSFVQNTPVIQSTMLNQILGQNIWFKCESLQSTGSFKIRGAANLILKTLEQRSISHIVASSSGNHAQAVAYIAQQLGIQATIFASASISPIKAKATQAYGATLKLFENRQLADIAVQQAASGSGVLWVPPFNHPDVIAGQATVAMEALANIAGNVDAIFAPCGGGGLLSGTVIAAQQYNQNTKVFGAEPLLANDAAQSLRSGSIQSLSGTPQTLADGAATPAVGEHTFSFLKCLTELVEVTEKQIAYWTQWLQHLIKIQVEPTSAMSMQAVLQWAQTAPKNSHALVILSGGNISQATHSAIWQTDYLQHMPSLELVV